MQKPIQIIAEEQSEKENTLVPENNPEQKCSLSIFGFVFFEL